MQGAGGVGADEFHLDFLPVADIGKPVCVVFFIDLGQHRMPGSRKNKKVDESRSRDFGFFNHRVVIADMAGSGFPAIFTGRHLLRLGIDHGKIG